MRIFLWIAGIIVGIFIIALIALNIYFTDERLQSMIVPQLQEAAGREVTVDNMSFSFFRTFPNFGLVADRILIPDDQGGTLASVEQMVLALNVFPYLTNNEIRISRLDLEQPEVMYIIYEDGTTNIDELLAHMETEEGATEDEPFDFDLQQMHIHNSRITYDDRLSRNQLYLGGLNAQTSLRFADTLQTTTSIDIRNITFTQNDREMVSGLEVKLETAASVDFENEILNIDTGNLNLAGLALNLNGSVSQWSAENILVDLIFASDSDDFAALLELVPDDYNDMLSGVEASGSLSIAGTITGEAGAEVIPAFQFVIAVDDGYIQYPGVEEPIHSITMDIEASNDVINIRSLGALAGGNQASAFGEIRLPLEDNATFALNIVIDADLSTIRNFYPLEDEGIELSGIFNTTAVAEGLLYEADQAEFDAEITLADGFIRLADVNEPIHDINVAMLLSQARADITSFSARAAGNILDFSGIIQDPFEEELTSFDVHTNIELDLATIKDFYPIDEDTLQLRGQLTASGTARGQMNDPQSADTDLQVSLIDGYIRYYDIAHPIENLNFESHVNSNYLNITRASLQTGNNNLSLSGHINNYLGDNITVDIQIESDFDISQAYEYFPMEEEYTMSGFLHANLGVQGPVNHMDDIILSGNVRLRDVHVDGEELMQPVTNLDASLNFSEGQAVLESFTMFMGESDFNLEATLSNYMALTYEAGETEPAVLSGSYHSRKLNIDELYDADAEEEPFPIELPNLVTKLTATVDTMIFMGMTATNVRGSAESDPTSITMPEGSLEMFGGTIAGSFVWNIPDPEHTNITFQGNLSDLRVESFFEEFQLGGNFRLHEFARGNFNAETEFFTELDVYLNPIIPTTEATGFFGMDQAELHNHPIQSALSSLLRVDEFMDLSLDAWTANFTIDDSMLNLEDLNITSSDVGLSLGGSQNLETNELNYTGELRMPERFTGNLSRLITSQGAQALTGDDGIMVIPVRITGTTDSPQPSLDEGSIENVLTEFLRSRAEEEGRDAARGILDRLRSN